MAEKGLTNQCQSTFPEADENANVIISHLEMFNWYVTEKEICQFSIAFRKRIYSQCYH